MEHIKVNMVPGSVPSICHVSQYDDGRSIMIHLYDGDSVYTIVGTETVKVKVRRSDGVSNEYSVTNLSTSYVILDTTVEMCLCAGYSECEVIITNGSVALGSGNFKMYVEADTYGKPISISTASGRFASFNTPLAEDLFKLNVALNPIQNLNGYTKPWAAGAGKNISYFCDDNVNSTRGASVTYADYNNLTITSTAAWTRVVFEIPCPENTAVAVSFRGLCTSNYKRIQFSPNADFSPQYKSITITDQEASYSTTFTTNAGTDTIYVCFYAATEIVGGDTVIKNFQIEKGSSATAYNPYTNVCPISGHNSAVLNRISKNICPNMSGVSDGGITTTVDEDGKITVSGTATGTSCYLTSFVNLIKTIPSGSPFTVSITEALPGNLRMLFNNGTADIYSGGTSTTSTRTNDVTSVRLHLTTTVGVSYNFSFYFQIEFGSVATEYTPCIDSIVSKTVVFGQTVYKGTLISKSRKILVTHVGINLGSINWSIPSGAKYFFSAELSIAPAGCPVGSIGTDLCSHYSSEKYSNVVNGNVPSGFTIPSTVKRIYLYDQSKKGLTGEQFKAAVNGVVLVYEVAEPFYIDVTNPDKNKCSIPDTTFVQYTEVELNEIPAGNYVYSTVLTSTDTDSSNCAVIFLDRNKNTIATRLLDRSVGSNRVSTTFTASSPIKYIRLYASSGYPSGAGDTANYVNNMICLQSESDPTEYKPYNPNNPINITTLIGGNTVYSDAGDVDVEYYTIA